jgi:hypothetical protein
MDWILWSNVIRVVLVGLSGICWRAGGSDAFPKAVRRYGCPLMIAISLLLTKNWWGFISIPFLIGAASLGYGINSKLIKFLKNKYLVRLVCGILYSTAALAVLWGNWWAYGFHILIVSTGVMLAGNQRFKYEAEREEVFIGILFGFMPIFG